jgi:hypothetical protein
MVLFSHVTFARVMVSSKDTRRSTPTRDWVLLVPAVRVLLCSTHGCNRLPNIALVRSEYADLVLTCLLGFGKKMQLAPLFFCALTIAHRCSTLHYQCRLLLPAMAPSLTSSSAVFQFYGVQCFLMAPITVTGFHALTCMVCTFESFSLMICCALLVLLQLHRLWFQEGCWREEGVACRLCWLDVLLWLLV